MRGGTKGQKHETIRSRVAEIYGRFEMTSLMSPDEIGVIHRMVCAGTWSEGAAILFSRECVIRRLMAEDRITRFRAEARAEDKAKWAQSKRNWRARLASA